MLRFANPARFMRLSAAILPYCAGATAALLAVGVILALFVAPPDYQQGEAVRIMYVHVPAAYMSSLVYAVVALGSAVTLICRVSGSLWGEPMWGTWWVWDARLTSVLVLFFLYLGYIALVHAFDDP